MMQVRSINENDIPKWQALSAEYDCYVKELVADLIEWYDGNDTSLDFISYMKAKISQGEAFMAVDSGDKCLGVIAFSKKNNRITFFGVAHSSDFQIVGNALFKNVLKQLNNSKSMYINEISSTSEWIQLHKKLYCTWGFCFHGNNIENGVPVKTFEKAPSVV